MNEEIYVPDSSRSPKWSSSLQEAWTEGKKQMFILHGNVFDIVGYEQNKVIEYRTLPDFLASQVFGTFDSVLYFDQVRGPKVLAYSKARLEKMNRHVERFIGAPEKLRDLKQVGSVFSLLDRYLELALLSEGEKPSIALIFDYAQFMVPSSSVSQIAKETGTVLATLLNWARSPYFKKAPFAFCLISEKLSDLNDSLTRSAHTGRIEIPFPDRDSRLAYIAFKAEGKNVQGWSEVDENSLSDLSAGMTLVHLQGLMESAMKGRQKLTLRKLKAYKKEMIEGECQGLIEFIEPSCTLELAVGQQEAKKRLTEDASLLENGRLDAVPMGYLFCGPVGTGKTFLAECYAGSVGIPCVKLLNFRSKYVGETEGNLEKILKVLRVMGPVAVVIDEADAMLGDRSSGSDSGTSSRVFGLFASQMGNTAYRGKIIWFLLTCRPDLLPIDIKRQGRCEVHIPLFYPESEDDFREMFIVMGKKNKIKIDPEEVPTIPTGMSLSGAEIEGVVMRAKRSALLENADDVTKLHLEAALQDFIPSAETEEKELQILAAVIESTSLNFLPKSVTDSPDWRAKAQARFRILKAELLE
jgi:AAA+ superfamily predicted ATPase